MVVESEGRSRLPNIIYLLTIQILPWDSDLDVQVSEPTIYYLAKYYNMSEFHYQLPGITDGRTYLLEINPNYTNNSVTDTLNVIDARWIDTETGLFIDISTVRKNWTAITDGVEGALMVKDKHHYNVWHSTIPENFLLTWMIGARLVPTTGKLFRRHSR